ncbi:MAG: DUF6159 family protein [bacterium]|nr:DUF6159 family protein [bacterium]
MPPQSFVPQSSTPATPPKIGKFRASRIIVRESWALLSHDKEILWLPVLSAITFLVSLALIGSVFYFGLLGGNVENLKGLEGAEQGVKDLTTYAVVFGYYLLLFFITNFFQAGVFTIVHARFNGGNLNLSDGLRGARSHAGKIFLWSLISATVGVVLQIVSDKSKLVGKIVSGLLGSAWNILTYFSLPSLVIGQASVTDSFKESAAMIRRTWGETIIVNFGVGLIFGLIITLLFAIGIVILILYPTLSVAIGVGSSLFILIILLSILSSSLNAIFKLVLFEYARTGTVPQGFSQDVVQSAIRAK